MKSVKQSVPISHPFDTHGICECDLRAVFFDNALKQAGSSAKAGSALVGLPAISAVKRQVYV